MLKKILLVSSLSLCLVNADKLDLILQKLDQIQQTTENNSKEIKVLKKKVEAQEKELVTEKSKVKKKFAIKNCNNIKVNSLKFKYSDNGVIRYYDLDYKLKNNYPEDINKISGRLIVTDNDDVKILNHYVNKKTEIKSHQDKEFKDRHVIESSLEDYFRTEKNKHIKFQIYHIVFKNGEELKCN